MTDELMEIAGSPPNTNSPSTVLEAEVNPEDVSKNTKSDNKN